MNNAEYRVCVFSTLSVDKVVREVVGKKIGLNGKEVNETKIVERIPGPQWGMRQASRTRALANLSHGLAGIVAETLELQVGMTQFLIFGSQMTEEIRMNVIEELGDLGYFLTVATRSLRMHFPSPTKKYKKFPLYTTKTTIVYDMIHVACEIADLQKKMYYGRVLNLDAIKEAVGKMVYLYWMACSLLVDKSPAEIFDMNIAKLSARYGNGYFESILEAHRNKAKEMVALKNAEKKPPATTDLGKATLKIVKTKPAKIKKDLAKAPD